MPPPHYTVKPPRQITNKMQQTPPTSQRLLNDLLTLTPCDTVTEAARLLECTRTTLHEQLAGHREMSPTQAIRLARLLRRSSLEVVAATQYHQARRDADRMLWLGLWQVARERPPMVL